MEYTSIPLLTDAINGDGCREVNAEIFMGGVIPEFSRKLDIQTPRIYVVSETHPESKSLAWIGDSSFSNSIFLSAQFLKNWPISTIKWAITHELGHISRYKHFRRSCFLCPMLGASFFLYLEKFLFGNAGAAPGMSIFFLTDIVIFFAAMPIAVLLSTLAFRMVSRGEEFRADMIAARLAGLDGGLAFFEKREPLENGIYLRFFWFLRTHPSARRRRKRLEKMKRLAKMLS